MTRYSRVARRLHWLTAVMIAAMFILGAWMAWLPPTLGAAAHRLYNLHESLGVAVLLVVAARFALRLGNPPPPLPAATPAAIRIAAALNHGGLYGLLLAMPVIGYLTNDAQGIHLVWFEILPLPSPRGRDDAAARLLSALHFWGAMALLALITLHIAAAAYHAAIRRDGVVQRML